MAHAFNFLIGIALSILGILGHWVLWLWVFWTLGILALGILGLWVFWAWVFRAGVFWAWVFRAGVFWAWVFRAWVFWVWVFWGGTGKYEGRYQGIGNGKVLKVRRLNRLCNILVHIHSHV